MYFHVHRRYYLHLNPISSTFHVNITTGNRPIDTHPFRWSRRSFLANSRANDVIGRFSHRRQLYWLHIGLICIPLWLHLLVYLPLFLKGRLIFLVGVCISLMWCHEFCSVIKKVLLLRPTKLRGVFCERHLVRFSGVFCIPAWHSLHDYMMLLERREGVCLSDTLGLEHWRSLFSRVTASSEAELLVL